jgi:hypothetical protein
MRNFLPGANFGERTESGCIKIQAECFVVSVEFLNRRHTNVHLGQRRGGVKRPR